MLPGGVLRISSDEDDRRIFLGLKFSIPGFFWEGKFGIFFCVWLDLSGDSSRDFLGIQNNLKIHGNARVPWPHSSASKVQPNLFCSYIIQFFLEIFKAWKFGMGFLGLVFGSGIFWGCVGSPRGF